MSKMKRLSNWELAGTVTYVVSILFAILIAISFSGCGSECGGLGSCIEIGDVPEDEAPSCEVTDECVGEVILDLCPPVVEPEACPPPTVQLIPAGRVLARVVDAVEAGVVPGFDEIGDLFLDDIHTNHYAKLVVEPEACPPPTVQVIVVYADPETDECDLTVPVGHRPIECRGKDHAR